ncbi:MAG TPA: amidohydrolase, partial [Thermoanaerobaculia bacterium]
QTTCAAHPIGYKGMMTAAKVLAAAAADLLADPKMVETARTDFQKETKGAAYVSPIPPDAKPKPF